MKELSLWTSDAIELMMAGAAEGVERPGKQKKEKRNKGLGKNWIPKIETNSLDYYHRVITILYMHTHTQNYQQMTTP